MEAGGGCKKGCGAGELAALLPPRPKRPPGPARFVEVPGASELSPGTGLMAKVEGKVIALFRVEGTYCAIDNACPHSGAALAKGRVAAGAVTCPWHGWTFDLGSGACLSGGSVGVERHPVRIEDGKVLVKVWPDES